MTETPPNPGTPVTAETAPSARPTAQSLHDSRSWQTWLLGIFLIWLCGITSYSITCYWPHEVTRKVTLKTPDGLRDTSVVTAVAMSDTVVMRRLAFGWPDSTSRANHSPRRFYAKAVVFEVAPERRFLILAMLAGILGAFVHAATSFGSYVGAGLLLSSWNWYYVLRPLIGGALGLGVYLLLRAGLLVGSSAVDAMSPFGVGAICFLTGMFSKQATRKLEQILDYVLSLKKDDLPHKLTE